MLLGARRVLVERLVTDDDREGALAEIEALALTEFTALLEAMEGLPVVVRLLDPPIHEFLPDLVELSVAAAVADERGTLDAALERRLSTTRRWHESNPMLGLRGVRLLTVLPQIIDAQVRALARPPSRCGPGGHDVRPELMVPLVADVAELTAGANGWRGRGRGPAQGPGPDLPIGVMVELPRAALTAAALAEHADFFSFGTNDLTQTSWGMSRDDAEANFLAPLPRGGACDRPLQDPRRGRGGRAVELSCADGRAARPGLGLGPAGSTPATRRRCGSSPHGLDYLSCSPPRIPVVRLEAGRQAVLAEMSGAGSDTR